MTEVRCCSQYETLEGLNVRGRHVRVLRWCLACRRISASCEACSQPWLGRHRVEVIGVALDALENVLKSGVALNQPENPCARGSPRSGSETAV